MTMDTKLSMLENLLNIKEPTEEIENVLTSYLELAGQEIIQWRFSYTGKFPDEVPAEYEVTQVFAVVEGYNQQGAEGQSMHSENNLYLTFKYGDMVDYIHRMVIPFVKVV